MYTDYKKKILNVLRTSKTDLSTAEVVRKCKISRITATKYLEILKAEGKIKVTRKVGRAKLYKIKRRGS